MKNEEEQWTWQEPETAWKGVGIYHITMVVSCRKPLLGELVIPDNDPEKARVNARDIFHVGRKEQDIIRTHMWPLTLRAVPRSREAVIVCVADKWCSLQETVFMRKR